MSDETYGNYQNEIYGKGSLMGILPSVTTDPRLLEGKARKALGERSFNYVAGGAGEKATMDSNRLAFRQWKLLPRMLRNMDEQDVSVELFGRKYKNPLLMAPIGVQGIFHEDKEAGLAQVCEEVGVPYIMSTASTSTIEEVAAASNDGDRWYQLYWPHDDDVTISLLSRAQAAGFSVLVVTLDTWSLGWRPADLDNGYVPFIKGVGCQVGFSDPVFRAKFEDANGCKIEDDIVSASRAWLSHIASGRAHTWEELALLRKHWAGPIVLKGIQHVDDAKKALEYGCNGIVVSNHGGRQVDGAIGSLDVLPEIVDAVGDQMTVLFDSGVRTGVDVIKALALGAKAVLVGRPVIYGLGIGGRDGAKQVFKGLLADFWQSMGLAGIRTVADCNRTVIRKVQHGGDVKAML
ncbi:putative lactate 2-monooxygenase [Penicillium oxalicum]|uniref:putative lactate 2-monooxygenase n=1 Tax=Penicillium oxalicum TaxID=69781 RepID=UPI0020B6DF94|nr:putative lactate 2-monooxygenase [Penicillium oxalicum]KAI2787202.1 putative lactate 2-monooxygenase [Penicillium oxalicum]